jgi:hypothetical protein
VLVAGGALLLLAAGVAFAQQDVPPERQVLILARALSYDDDIKSRVGDDVHLAVLSKPGNAGSEAMSAAMQKAFKGISAVKVQGLPLRISALPFSSGAARARAGGSPHRHLLDICAGLEADLPAIIEVTRKNRRLSIGSREDHMGRGLALGVMPMDGKPTIIVNLPAARAEGAAFSSDLLRLAKVIK